MQDIYHQQYHVWEAMPEVAMRHLKLSSRGCSSWFVKSFPEIPFCWMQVAQSLLPLLTPQDAVSDMVSSEGNMMMPGVDLFTRVSAEYLFLSTHRPCF